MTTEREFVLRVFSNYEVQCAEVCLEGDGDICFDRNLSEGCVLSVSISEDGCMLWWAGLFDGVAEYGHGWDEGKLGAMLRLIEEKS